MRFDDFDRGLQRRRSVLGDDWVARATATATAFTAQWQDFITRTAWHAVWCQEGLDNDTRRLLAMTATLALGRWEEYEMHVHAALRAGVSEAVLQDMLRLASLYCGVPAANTGFRIAAHALAEVGRPSPPAPITPLQRERTFHTFSEPQMRVVLQGPEKGVPVVLCHALGLDLSMWSGVSSHLAASGHPVMRYDLRGHGESDRHCKVTVEALIEDAARLVLEWGMGPVVFVGLSLGGVIAQGLALKYPDRVRALVLANTVAAYPEMSRAAFKARADQVRNAGLEPIMDAVVQRYVSQQFQIDEPAATAKLRAQLRRCSASGYADCCEELAKLDWSDQLCDIRVPTCIFSGASDVAAPRELQLLLANGISQARHITLDCGHLPTLEAQTTFLLELVAFLTELEGAA